ncbi:MAG: hypothetical protein Fur0010_04700 [Bdellovibrio sp.]
MIFVTQGYEKGATLPLFLRACSCFNSEILENFTIILDKQSLRECGNIRIENDYLIGESIKIPAITYSRMSSITPSQASLEIALELINKDDFLLTLPTNKNQLTIKKKPVGGYTEFLRQYFGLNNLAMTFRSPTMQMLLVSDHISLSYASKLSTNDFVNRTTMALESRYFSINRILFLGINPHAGESGILGNDETIIGRAIDKLKKRYPKYSFEGPIPADSILIKESDYERTLIVSPYHDQGLSLFKSKNGIIGANITLGMPFIRYSVDHGTAPGKELDSLNYTGHHFLINLILKDWVRSYGK